MNRATPSQRIIAVVEYCKLSYNALSKKMGRSNAQFLHDIVKGVTKNVTENVATEINMIFPEINKYWLITGEGDMLKNIKQIDVVQEPKAPYSNMPTVITVDNMGNENIVLVPIEARAGYVQGFYKPTSFVSPFQGIKEKAQPTRDKYLSLEEMKKIVAINADHDYYRYFMLCFYLGGVDFVDIANIKKEHIRNGRIKFTRFKGGTSEVIDNLILPEAQKILDYYFDADFDYLTPIHKFYYNSHRNDYTSGIQLIFIGAGINAYVGSKSPRYSFIHIGNKELYLNRDIIKEIVGHAQSDTHSIYEGRFPNHIKDDIHKKIINSVLE